MNAARVGVDAVGGVIVGPGSPNTYVNGIPWALMGDAVAPHGKGRHAGPTLMTGSSNVYANGIRVCRLGDLATCGHTISSGSGNVFAN